MSHQCLALFFETQSHIAQAARNLLWNPGWPWTLCLSLLSARITGEHHHTWSGCSFKSVSSLPFADHRVRSYHNCSLSTTPKLQWPHLWRALLLLHHKRLGHQDTKEGGPSFFKLGTTGPSWEVSVTLDSLPASQTCGWLYWYTTNSIRTPPRGPQTALNLHGNSGMYGILFSPFHHQEHQGTRS
jgi:hypothetical protein